MNIIENDDQEKNTKKLVIQFAHMMNASDKKIQESDSSSEKFMLTISKKTYEKQMFQLLDQLKTYDELCRNNGNTYDV